MALFRFPKRDARHFSDETPWQRFFRIILVTLLFCGVLWGFWMNNERQMDRIRQKDIPALDSTGTLSSGQQDQLREYIARFRDTYGLGILITVRNEPFPQNFLLPQEKAGILFFGLCPDARQVALEVPPLAEKALGAEFIRYLREEHFIPYFARNDWPAGLASALSMLAERLDRALAPEQPDAPTLPRTTGNK